MDNPNLQSAQFNKDKGEQMQLFDTKTSPNAQWPTPRQAAAAKFWIPQIRQTLAAARGDASTIGS